MLTSEQPTNPDPPPCHVGGDGSPLVLLHGLGGTWEVWKPVLPTLEAAHRVIALTLPGHQGGTPFRGNGDATVAALADQLVAMLSAQGIRSAHIVGNSLGGWLALELARQGVARSITALSPAGGWKTDADYRSIARTFKLAYALIGKTQGLFSSVAGSPSMRGLLTRQMMQRGDRLSRSDFLGIFRALARTSVFTGLLRSMASAGPFQPLSAGNTPIVIAWCERDQVIPYARYGVAFRERIKGLREAVIPGAGHVPMWDNPESVARTILALTSEVDGVSVHCSTSS
jgi:pimeloyl-ACP methyl ester carboxylesterase